MTSPVLFALALDGKGGAATPPAPAMAGDAAAWVHLDAYHAEARAWIQRELPDLDPLLVDALLAEETRPRLLEFPHGLLLILRGMNFNADADPEDMISVRLWADAKRLVTLRHHPVKTAEDVRARLLQGRGPNDIGGLLAAFAAALFERMEPVLTDLEDRVDELEEEVIASPDDSDIDPILDLRRRTIIFRRHIAPQREAIGQLRACGQDWLSPLHRRHLQESHDRLTRYVEDLDALRERAQAVKDELDRTLGQKFSRHLYLISVMTAIFLPLTFLTGLLGSNVAGIPYAEHPHAFWVVCGIALLLGLLGLAWMKLRRWF